MRVFWNYFSIFTVALILCTNSAWAMSDTPEEDLNNEQAIEIELAGQSRQKCEDKDIIFEINGVHLKLPRKTVYSIKDDPKNPYNKVEDLKDSPLEFKCDIKIIENVKGAGGFSAVNLEEEQKKIEERIKKISSGKYESGDGKKTFPNGIRRNGSKKRQYYVFPEDLTPQSPVKPMVIGCHGVIDHFNDGYGFGSCWFNIYHPAGIAFKVTKAGRSRWWPEEKLPEMHKYYVDLFNKYIVQEEMKIQ